MADAAMHMYSAAIDTLPDAHDSEFPHRAGIILAGLRKLQGSLSEAAGRSRVTPSVIVALSGVRHRYDELMETAALGRQRRWVSGCTSPVDTPSCRTRRRPRGGPA